LPIRFSFWWLLCLLWVAKIFWLSSDAFSGEATSPFLATLLQYLHIHLEPAAFGVLHTFIRKSAHLFEFAVLTFLLYRSLYGRGRLMWSPRIARWCLLIAAAAALSDEFHQIFTSNRGPSFTDCTIDIAGAVMSVWVTRLVTKHRSSKQTPPAGTPETTTLQILEDA
jgi:VanZ family protein